MMMNEYEESNCWHYCEYCFNPCSVFCGCPGEKKAMVEETKREMLNAIMADLNELNVDLYVRGEKQCN